MNDTASSGSDSDQNGGNLVEAEKLRLEQARYRADILKWIVVAVGAVISFAVVDYGKLRLEQFRVQALACDRAVVVLCERRGRDRQS